MSNAKAIADKAKAAIANGGGAEKSKEIVPIPQTLKGLKTTDIYKIFDLYSLQIAQLVPKHLDPERVLKIFATQVRRNPAIAECTTESVLGALMQCAELGFMPSPALQQVYFIPRKNKYNQGRKELEFQLGYQGLIDLAMRSDRISNIRARVVYEKDLFDVVMGLDESITHKPNLSGDRGFPILAYAVIEYKDGGKYPEIMTADEIKKVREVSESKDSTFSPWNNWPTEMWRKTVLRRALKYAPKSTDYAMLDAIGRDGAVTVMDDKGDLVHKNIAETDYVELPIEADTPEEKTAIATSKPATPVQLATIRKYAGELTGKLDDKDAADLEDFLAGEAKTFEEANSWIEFLAKKRK